MNRLYQVMARWGAIGLPLLLSGCAAYFHQPTGPRSARLGEETAVTTNLRSLPPARDKIVAAVYKFRDQTGQYKQSENGTSFSTAISQGTTNILLKALEESNWFTPIERENVANLLNERKIVRSSVAQYKEGENLPPLLFAGIILEGGIVSYDANIITGGAGLRYFSSGGSTQYRQDRVTVYLRAVATRSGKILKTIYTSKTILSQSVDASVFRFVSFKRLLEAETGFTTTEPGQMAVTEAIEKAVYALVVEGIQDGLWSVSEKAAAQAKPLLDSYEREKTEMSQTDVYGSRISTTAPARFSLQPYIDGTRLYTDYTQRATRVGYGLSLEAYLTPVVGLQVNAATGALTSGDVNRSFSSLGASVLFRALPNQPVSPLFTVGGGMLVQRSAGTFYSLRGQRYGEATGGAGVQYNPNRYIGIRTMLEAHLPFSDNIDGLVAGLHNDYYLRGTLGLTVNLGRFGRVKPGKATPISVAPAPPAPQATPPPATPKKP
ncbi:CsgG/HfaB family protein [Fibrella sp. HMF5335]|uniref:CsgG/HfaB family protein n=1 Tax=Fibrella rubiginis TaxID=2817060 RepID=A0A939GEG8_9BACT|nr:CsgG/HfaB family protein [Fibrella rubiginis]MBO0937489.1 CsgG/HfaB family protein [Fibrella rubiginis]